MSDRTCCVDGCTSPYLAKGFCNRHYLRWKSTGHPGEGGPIPQRQCDICGTNFMPYREYQRACSKRCRERLPDRIEAQRLYDARPGRRRNQNIARTVNRTPERSAEQQAVQRQYNLRRYNMTVEQYDEKLTAQSGLCIICGDPPNPNGVRAASRLHVDHDHATGKNRDLLCNGCNRGLGYMKDDPTLLRAAADYIERHRLT